MDSSAEAQEVTLEDIKEYINSGSSGSISWFQRVEISYRDYAAHSYVKVNWDENSPRFNDAPWKSSVVGSLPGFRMDSGEYVFVLLRGAHDGLPASWHIGKNDTSRFVGVSDLDLSALIKDVEICSGDPLMPYVIKVSDPKDPESVSISSGKICLRSQIVSEPDHITSMAAEVMPWLGKLIDGKRSLHRFPVGGVGETGVPLTHRVTLSDFVR